MSCTLWQAQYLLEWGKNICEPVGIFLAFTAAVMWGGKYLIYSIWRWRQLITVQFSALSWRLGKAGGLVFSFFYCGYNIIRLVFPLSVVASAPHPPWPCLTAERRVYRRSEQHHLSTVFAWSTSSDLSFSAAFWGQLCKTAMSPHTVGGWLLWLVLSYEMWHTLLGCHLHYLYTRLLDVKELFWDVPLTKSESNGNSEK